MAHSSGPQGPYLPPGGRQPQAGQPGQPSRGQAGQPSQSSQPSPWPPGPQAAGSTAYLPGGYPPPPSYLQGGPTAPLPPGGPSQASQAEQSKGFLRALFDFSFRHYITFRLVGVLYALLIAGIALYALALVLLAFNISGTVGAFTLLIGAPLFFLIGTVLVRILLEGVAVQFRIAENTTEMARALRRSPPTE